MCATGGSKKMLFYKLPTSPGKHFEGRSGKSPELEDEILQYVMGLRNNGMPKDFDDKITAFYKFVIGLRKTIATCYHKKATRIKLLCTSICRQTRQSKGKGKIP
jgi:hypothetical protein